MKRISKGWFIALLVAVDLLMYGSAFSAGILFSAEEVVGGLGLVVLMILLALGYVAVEAVWLYRVWSTIQDGKARATPGRAAGFMFIPLFNLYWRFQAFWGFARDYNRFVQRHGRQAPTLPEGLFLAHAILPLTAWLPLLGLVIAFADFVIVIIMVSKGTDGANALIDSAPTTGQWAEAGAAAPS